jgi:hypothetical protein
MLLRAKEIFGQAVRGPPSLAVMLNEKTSG